MENTTFTLTPAGCAKPITVDMSKAYTPSLEEIEKVCGQSVAENWIFVFVPYQRGFVTLRYTRQSGDIILYSAATNGGQRDCGYFLKKGDNWATHCNTWAEVQVEAAKLAQ